MVPNTHLQKSHSSMRGEIWSQQLSKCRYLSTDSSTRSIDHSRYRRSIRNHLLENMVEIDGRCQFTYGELRSIVDGRLKINFVVDFINDTCANLPRFPNVSSSVTRGGRQTEKSKKNAVRAGWPRRFALIQATSRAEVDVISAKLCSCDRAIFS